MIQIPIPADQPDVTMRVTLGAADFLLRLNWSERELRWYADLRDADGNALQMGVKVVADWPLFRKLNADGRPRGNVYALDLSGAKEPPQYTWGDRWILVFDDGT